MPSFAGFFLFLALLGLLALEVPLTVWRWKAGRRRSCLLPPIALAVALAIGGAAGRTGGMRLIRHRFESNRMAYDAIADDVMRGTYPRRMKPEHRHLAYWAIMLQESSTEGPMKQPVGASFLVVSHGFAGHLGFVRLADEATANRLLSSPPPGGWTRWLGRLGDNWYVVAN